MIRLRDFLLATAGLALADPAPARAESDAQLWTEVGVEWALSRHFELSYEQNLRFDQDVSRVSEVLPDFGLEYRPHRVFRLGVGYRLAYERDGDGAFELRHRFHGDARTRVELGPIKASHRLRFQEKYTGPTDREPRRALRNRLTTEWRTLEPWFPGAEAEVFHRLGDGEAIRFNKIRITGFVVYDFGSPEVEMYYRIELPQDDPDDPTLHIVGLAFGYSI